MHSVMKIKNDHQKKKNCVIKIPWFFPDFLKKCQIPWLFPDWKNAFQLPWFPEDVGTLLVDHQSSQWDYRFYCTLVTLIRRSTYLRWSWLQFSDVLFLPWCSCRDVERPFPPSPHRSLQSDSSCSPYSYTPSSSTTFNSLRYKHCTGSAMWQISVTNSHGQSACKQDLDVKLYRNQNSWSYLATVVTAVRVM